MNFRPEIIFEDNHLLAVNKPPGILSQGDRTGDPSMRDLMMDFIKVRDKKPGNVYQNVQIPLKDDHTFQRGEGFQELHCHMYTVEWCAGFWTHYKGDRIYKKGYKKERGLAQF